MNDHSFPKRLRLTSRSDFRLVYERRSSVGDHWVRMLGRLNELEHSRIGLSVSRQVGNAVRRNRWKRLLREAFRLSRDRLPMGLDFIVIPRNDGEPEFQTLMKSMVDLAWRLSKRLKCEAAEARRDEQNEKSHSTSQKHQEDE